MRRRASPVCRRTAAGSYDFASPLNGSTLVAGVAYADLAAINATTYQYTVRAVILGAGNAQVESAGTASNPVIADGTSRDRGCPQLARPRIATRGAAAVSEYWIADVLARSVIVQRGPLAGAYQEFTPLLAQVPEGEITESCSADPLGAFRAHGSRGVTVPTRSMDRSKDTISATPVASA